MRDRLYQFRMKIEQWMSGRNGMDMLGRDLYILCAVILILEMFLHTGVLYWFALAGLVYGLFRSLSKNTSGRRAEETKYLQWREKPLRYIKLFQRQWKDRKIYRYYLCPNCKQTIRVPKGKGKIEIRCPKCSAKFIKKT